MKKMVLAAFLVTVLLTGCRMDSTPDAVVDEVKQMKITSYRTADEVEKAKKERASVKNETKWVVNKEHQKILQDIQDILKEIDEKKVEGCRLVDTDLKNDSLGDLIKMEEYSTNVTEPVWMDDNNYYQIRFSDKASREKFLETMEKIGFTGITAQVEKCEASKQTECVFGNHGISFELTESGEKADFYNRLSINIYETYVVVPEFLQNHLNDKFLQAFRVNSVESGEKIERISYYSQYNNSITYLDGVNYFIGGKLLQVNLYVELRDCEIDGDNKKENEKKRFCASEETKEAVLDFLTQFSLSQEQASDAVKQIADDGIEKGEVGNVHWYWDEIESDTYEETWRLRIQEEK